MKDKYQIALDKWYDTQTKLTGKYVYRIPYIQHIQHNYTVITLYLN